MNVTSRQKQTHLSQGIFGLGVFAGWGMTYKDRLHYSFYCESEMSLCLKLTKPIATYSQHSGSFILFINLMKLITLVPYQQQANVVSHVRTGHSWAVEIPGFTLSVHTDSLIIDY